MQNHIPIGYIVSCGKVEIDEEKAKTVTQIYMDYLEGKTLNQIAKNLTQNHVPNANYNTNWTHGAVIIILENSKYLGDEFFPPIITKITFQKVVQARQDRMRKTTKKVAPSMIRSYPKKPSRIYIPSAIQILDDEIKNNPNNLDLIYKRAELFYTNTKIYDIT